MTPKFRAWTGNEMRYDIAGFDWDESFGVHNAWLGNNIEYNADNFLMNVLLMQYTGLKDKNGVEVYEGDVVKGQITLGYKRTGVIKFDTDAFCFVEFWKEGMLTMFEENPDRMTIYNGFGGYEVIGNIYENPELLEEQNK